MLDNKIDINFLTLFSLITFFVFLLITKYGKKIRNGILLDTDYNKPQAFHIEATTRCGGLAAFISLIIFTVLNNLFFAVFYILYPLLAEYTIYAPDGDAAFSRIRAEPEASSSVVFIN